MCSTYIALSISLIHLELMRHEGKSRQSHLELTRHEGNTERSQLVAALQVALQVSISFLSLTLGFCCILGYSVLCHDLIQSGLLLLGNGICVLSMAVWLTAKDNLRGNSSIRSATSIKARGKCGYRISRVSSIKNCQQASSSTKYNFMPCTKPKCIC